MTIKTIFLDRDGVINEVVLRSGLVSSPRALSEFAIRPEFVEFYKQLETLKLNVFVVSNQPDVSRNLLPLAELESMNEQMRRFNFQEILYCTHDDSAECLCRKPKPGMLTGLLQRYRLNAVDALMLGDSKKDILAGISAGVTTVYLRRAYNQQLDCHPDFVVDHFAEVLKIIENKRSLG